MDSGHYDCCLCVVCGRVTTTAVGLLRMVRGVRACVLHQSSDAVYTYEYARTYVGQRVLL